MSVFALVPKSCFPMKSFNQLPHVLGSDTKLLFRPKKYYSEQEQKQQLGVAENGEVGDKVPH